MKTFINIKQFHEAAAATLEPSVYHFYAGGAADEITLRANEQAYGDIKLLPRILHGINKPCMEIQLLKQHLDIPVLIAPMAYLKLAHPEGDLAIAQATHQIASTMIVSMLSTTDIIDIAKTAHNPPWLQLYFYKDRNIMLKLLQRAEKAHCSAIVITVDAPIYGRRDRELQTPLCLPHAIYPENLIAAGLTIPRDINNLANYLASLLEPNLTWDDIRWLKQNTQLPIILKGIMHPEDAKIAVDIGVSGIIVSNHGGRQLDTMPASIELLSSIAEAINKQIILLLDGGIRRGTDILKAIALGADAVLIGRPIIWGLAVSGTDGVYQILEILRQELNSAMALVGADYISKISHELLHV